MSEALTRIVDEDDPVLFQTDVLTREQIREDETDLEDDLWDAYLAAAVEKVESESRRVLLPQTWRLSLDDYPDCGEIRLERCPVRSVEAFEVQNSEGDWETVDPENYEVDTSSEPGRIVKSKGGVWPTPYPRIGGIRITFSAGYDNASLVPRRAMQCLRLLVGHWYRNRTPVALGTIATELQLTYENLIRGLRW